ncbi:hypothetical protein D3C80_954160 [compost metagenome]
MPGGLQHGSHLARTDALVARQAGTVLHYQMRSCDALARQPLTDSPLRSLGVVWIGAVAVLRPQGQEQLPRHGVVTVLVDVADDLHDVRGEGTGNQRGALRHAALAVLAEDAAAEFLPDAAHGASRIGRMIEQRHVGLRAAALGNLPGRHQVGAVELGHRVETQFRPRGAGGRGGHLDLVLDPHVGQRRIHQYRGLAGIAAYHQANALQVDQQRVRADQERLVVVAAIVIEHR